MSTPGLKALEADLTKLGLFVSSAGRHDLWEVANNARQQLIADHPDVFPRKNNFFGWIRQWYRRNYA